MRELVEINRCRDDDDDDDDDDVCERSEEEFEGVVNFQAFREFSDRHNTDNDAEASFRFR